jgi:hypothetical protein
MPASKTRACRGFCFCQSGGFGNEKRTDSARENQTGTSRLLRHFIFREFDMLAQFRIVFAEL